MLHPEVPVRHRRDLRRHLFAGSLVIISALTTFLLVVLWLEIVHQNDVPALPPPVADVNFNTSGYIGGTTGYKNLRVFDGTPITNINWLTADSGTYAIDTYSQSTRVGLESNVGGSFTATNLQDFNPRRYTTYDGGTHTLFTCIQSESACAVCSSASVATPISYTCDARARILTVMYDGHAYTEGPESSFWRQHQP